jgi:hypothetical protein
VDPCQDGVAGPGVVVGRDKDCQVRKVGVSPADYRGGPPFLATRLGNRDHGVGADQGAVLVLAGEEAKAESSIAGCPPLQPCIDRRQRATAWPLGPSSAHHSCIYRGRGSSAPQNVVWYRRQLAHWVVRSGKSEAPQILAAIKSTGRLFSATSSSTFMS